MCLWIFVQSSKASVILPEFTCHILEVTSMQSSKNQSEMLTKLVLLLKRSLYPYNRQCLIFLLTRGMHEKKSSNFMNEFVLFCIFFKRKKEREREKKSLTKFIPVFFQIDFGIEMSWSNFVYSSRIRT